MVCPQGLYQAFLPENQRDPRPLALVSLGAEVIEMRKDKFCALIGDDEEFREKLTSMEIEYPRSVCDCGPSDVRL